MPYKAKLVTRSTDTSTITEDTLNKGSALTHGELDSDLINLRDQSIGIASDDSTVIDVGMGNTLKVAGAGTITTSVSGQTLTITGAAESQSIFQTIAVAGQSSVVADTTTDTLTLVGSGNIAITTNATTDTITITGTDANTTYGLSAETTIGGTNLRLTGSDATTDNVKLAEGTGITITRTDADTITIAATSSASTGDLTIAGTTISAETTNADITITSTGTGNLNVDMDTLRIGDSNANATITTNGTGDLILNTNSGTNSGSITIEDAANGRIIATPNGEGYVNLGYGDLKAALKQTNTLIPNNAMADHGANRVWVQTLDQSTVSATNQRIYANNDLLSVQLTGTTGTNSNNRIRQMTAVEVDLNGINFGYDQTGYKAAIVGRQNVVDTINQSATAATVTTTQAGNNLCNVGSTNATAQAGDITITDAIGVSGSVEIIAGTGRTTTATNTYGQYAYLTSSGAGTKNITNWYALYAADTSATVTNKYGLYIANDDHQSRLGTIERYKEKQNALTSSSTITVDVNLAPVHTVTLGINTQFGIANLATGETVTLIIRQDGTGSRTATFTSDTSTAVKFAGGVSTLSTAASAIDVVTIYNDGTNFLGNIAKAYA